MASPAPVFYCGQSSNNQIFNRFAVDNVDNLQNGQIGYRDDQLELIISFNSLTGAPEIDKLEGYASETYLAVSDGAAYYVLTFPIAPGGSIKDNQGLCDYNSTPLGFWIGGNGKKVTFDGTNYSYSAPPNFKPSTTYRLAMFETYAEANSVFNPQPPEKKISPAEIAGIVVFVLVTIGGIGLVLFFVFRKRSTTSNYGKSNNNMAAAVAPPLSSADPSATPTTTPAS